MTCFGCKKREKVVIYVHLSDRQGELGGERQGRRRKVKSRAEQTETQTEIVNGLLSSTGMWFVISVTLHNSNIHTVTCTRTYSMSYYHFERSQPD